MIMLVIVAAALLGVLYMLLSGVGTPSIWSHPAGQRQPSRRAWGDRGTDRSARGDIGRRRTERQSFGLQRDSGMTCPTDQHEPRNRPRPKKTSSFLGRNFPIRRPQSTPEALDEERPVDVSGSDTAGKRKSPS